MDINLYDFQQGFYDKIWHKLFEEDVDKLCCVLPTGGGKSVIIGKLANELEGRTLILTHRIEILHQNSKWIKNCGILSSKDNTMRHDNKVIIAMVQTLYARIENYGIEYIGEIDNIILDEIQILIFEKVFSRYNFKKLIGFTATPVLNKKKYTNIDGVEFVEPYTLSEIFDDIVQGPDTQDLIDINKLVQDFNIALRLPDFDKLKESESSPDGYTKQSLDEVYTNTASLDILWESYAKYCKGKKTLIFNASTKINRFVYELFESKGLNVKMFDSVNATDINPETDKKYTRDEIVEWFRNERDAILINTNVFTTGFDVTDIEAIIVNRATKSLSLFLQMYGRGSRITTKIFKDSFTGIDLGQNIHTHGIWSKRRDWSEYFFSPGKKLRRTIDLLNTWECASCQSLNIVGEIICAYCGAEKLNVVIDGKMKKYKEGELQIVNDMPSPNAMSIINYTLAQNKNAAFAFKLLDRRIVELFIHYNVSKSYYNNRKDDFAASVKKLFLPVYFAICKSELHGANRTIDKQLEKLINKIEKIYE